MDVIRGFLCINNYFVIVSVVDLMVHKKVPNVFFCCNIMSSIREFVVYYRTQTKFGVR